MIGMIDSIRCTALVIRQMAADYAVQDPCARAKHLRSLGRCLSAVSLLCILLLPAAVFAIEIFDPLVDKAYNDYRMDWFNAILEYVKPTFYILATIEICWAAAIWAFEKDNLSSLAIEILKKFMFIGFFFMVLQNAGTWIPSITDTFEHAGERAIARADEGTPDITTDSILTTGLDVIAKLWADTLVIAVPMLAIPTSIMGTSIPFATAAITFAEMKILLCVITSVIVVIAFVVAAAQYFCIKVESSVLFAAGAIFLCMGASTWTKDYVHKYLNYAINVGVRLLVLILILSLTLNAVGKMAVEFTFDFMPMLEVMAGSILQAILAVKAPELAGALLGGGPGLTAGSAGGAMSSALRTSAMVAQAGVAGLRGVGGMLNSSATSAASARATKAAAGNSGSPGAASSLGGLGNAMGGSGNAGGPRPPGLGDAKGGGGSGDQSLNNAAAPGRGAPHAGGSLDGGGGKSGNGGNEGGGQRQQSSQESAAHAPRDSGNQGSHPGPTGDSANTNRTNLATDANTHGTSSSTDANANATSPSTDANANGITSSTDANADTEDAPQSPGNASSGISSLYTDATPPPSRPATPSSRGTPPPLPTRAPVASLKKGTVPNDSNSSQPKPRTDR